MDIQGNDMKEQAQLVRKTFFDWKQNNEQIDDVSVIGIRIDTPT